MDNILQLIILLFFNIHYLSLYQNTPHMKKKSVYKIIRLIRELKGITRDQMASELKLTVSGYGKIERGEVDLNLTKLDQIARILNVEIFRLFDFEISKAFSLTLPEDSNIQAQGYSENFTNIPGIVAHEKYLKLLEKEIALLEKEIEILKHPTTKITSRKK